MAGRYLVTGVQLGLLRALPDRERLELIEEIIEYQFIGNSQINVREEADLIGDECGWLRMEGI